MMIASENGKNKNSTVVPLWWYHFFWPRHCWPLLHLWRQFARNKFIVVIAYDFLCFEQSSQKQKLWECQFVSTESGLLFHAGKAKLQSSGLSRRHFDERATHMTQKNVRKISKLRWLKVEEVCIQTIPFVKF